MAVSWFEFETPDDQLLALAGCILFLLIGLLRTWRWSSRTTREIRGLIEANTSAQQRLVKLEENVSRVRVVSDARESDERARHDEDVVDVLNSLLTLNDSLRNPRKAPPQEQVREPRRRRKKA